MIITTNGSRHKLKQKYHARPETTCVITIKVVNDYNDANLYR